MSESIKDELTYKIIGCAMKVQSVLGNGFQLGIYQRALAIEMEQQELSFQSDLNMPVFYKEHDIGTCQVDFLVEEKVILVLKAVNKLEDLHLAEGLKGLNAHNVGLGLLVNFGTQSLEVKRLRNLENNDN